MGRHNRVFANMAGLAFCLGGLASTVLAADKAQKTATELMVADFNSGAKPNNLGGDFGAWIKDPSDPMQGCIESFDHANRFGSSGFALRLIYSVDSKNPAFGGLWMRLQNLDASKFDSLAFRVRGDPKMGVPCSLPRWPLPRAANFSLVSKPALHLAEACPCASGKEPTSRFADR